jgi:uncharacterized protein YaiI (UPF0178 family)
MVHRFADRLGVPVIYVANHPNPKPATAVATAATADYPGMFIVGDGADAADDYIVAHAGKGDLVITRDIPFAARLVARGVAVLNDRGVAFTADNIRERLSERDFHVTLAAAGIKPDKTKTYTPRDINNFANSLDRILRGIL